MVVELTSNTDTDTETRARLSQGTSSVAIYRMVASALANISAQGTIIDVGCGSGQLFGFLSDRFERYIGVDIVQYKGFPSDAEFLQIDLESGTTRLDSQIGDVVLSVETIEHLENPRAHVRELVRLAKPGGIICVTTPNQLSLLSKLTLLFKNQFNAFTDTSYPAHITALLECDLKRIFSESGLCEQATHFSHCGRIPGTSWHHPRILSRVFLRALSDNFLLVGRRLA